MFKIAGTPYQLFLDSKDYTSLPVEEKVKKLEGVVLDLEEAEFNLRCDKSDLEQKVTAWQRRFVKMSKKSVRSVIL